MIKVALSLCMQAKACTHRHILTYAVRISEV